jgi:hypothetical protein
MKLSKVLFLIAILSAVLAWLYFVEIKQREETKSTEEKASHLVQLDKAGIIAIDLDSESQTIELRKPADTWVIAVPVKTRADQPAVESIIRSLEDASPEKTLLDQNADWSQYGLEKPSFVVSASTKDKTIKLHFGEHNPSRSSYYLRIDSDPRLFLVADTLKNSLDKKLIDVRDKTIWGMSPSDIDHIEIYKNGVESALKSEPDGKWVMTKPQQIKVKKDAINRQLNALVNIEAKEVIDDLGEAYKSYGLEKASTWIRLKGKKLSQTLLIGNQTTDKKDAKEPDLYVQIEGNPTVFVIDGRKVSDLLRSDITHLQDKSVVDFSPGDVEKVSIEIDGKTWTAVRGADKKWDLEKPEKLSKLDGWSISSILWDIRDIEWKSIRNIKAEELSKFHLDKPQLIISVSDNRGNRTVTLKAGWEAEFDSPAGKNTIGQTKVNGDKSTEGHEGNNNQVSIKPLAPPTVNMIVDGGETEQGNLFVVDGNFVDRLRRNLDRLIERK